MEEVEDPVLGMGNAPEARENLEYSRKEYGRAKRARKS